MLNAFPSWFYVSQYSFLFFHFPLMYHHIYSIIRIIIILWFVVCENHTELVTAGLFVCALTYIPSDSAGRKVTFTACLLMDWLVGRLLLFSFSTESRVWI
jgi:hypothetical protein